MVGTRRLLVFDYTCFQGVAHVLWSHLDINTKIQQRVLGKDGKLIDEVLLLC